LAHTRDYLLSVAALCHTGPEEPLALRLRGAVAVIIGPIRAKAALELVLPRPGRIAVHVDPGEVAAADSEDGDAGKEKDGANS